MADCNEETGGTRSMDIIDLIRQKLSFDAQKYAGQSLIDRPREDSLSEAIGAYLSTMGTPIQVEKANKNLLRQMEDPNFVLNFAPMGMGVGMAGMMVGPKAKGWDKLVKFSNMADKMERAEISDNLAKFNLDPETLRTLYKNSTPIELKYALSHDDLYKQYPELQDIPLTFRKGLGQGGSYSEPSELYPKGMIEINYANSPEGLAKTSLHEIQHAIQKKEGWARGGSPENVKIPVNPKIEFSKMKKFEDDLLKKYGYNPKSKWRESELYNLENKITDAEYNTLSQLRNKVQQEENMYNMTDIEAYQSLAGEIEARDTASRMKLTPEERLSQMPYASQGIPLKDWIVNMEGGGPAMQIGPVYHGSPYKFTKFANEKIGTGEGAQAFGYGHYLSESPDVAREYLNAGAQVKPRFPYGVDKRMGKWVVYDENNNYATLKEFSNKESANKLIDQLRKSFDDKFNSQGNIYTATINKGKPSSADVFLEWDKKVPIGSTKLDKEYNAYIHKPEVLNAIESAKKDYPEAFKDTVNTFGQFYQGLSRWLGDEKASKYLASKGITGNKYPTGSLSGIKGSDKYNYVVFDPKNITIDAINDVPIQKLIQEQMEKEMGSLNLMDKPKPKPKPKTMKELFETPWDELTPEEQLRASRIMEE